jgi:ribonucleoside-diphosphate reductase alpha chain
MDATGETDIEKSPYWKATSADVDWTAGVKLQAAAQRWICHSISRTSNLPKNASHSLISDIYIEAWKSGCKGFTVYRDGSRTGVLLTGETTTAWFEGIPTEELEKCLEVGRANMGKMPEKYINFLGEVEIELKKRSGEFDERPVKVLDVHAPKRRNQLECDIHRVNVKGESYTVLVGLLDDKPYEVFCGLSEQFELPKKIKKGLIIKNGKKDGVATYNLKIPVGDEYMLFKDIVNIFDNPTYGAFTRTISLALRHGVPIQFLVEQLRKDKHGDFTSFSNVIARVLSKNYIKDGTKVTEEKTCSSCNSAALVYQEGCVLCTNCGHSKCS